MEMHQIRYFLAVCEDLNFTRAAEPPQVRQALVLRQRREGADRQWNSGEIPAEHAIRGFHSASLLVANAAPTGAILTDIFGFTEMAREGSRIRYKAGDTALGGIIDLNAPGGLQRGRSGAGTVHHIAFRAASDAVQTQMAERLLRNHDIRTTEQTNRDYFRAVYFPEPNGILFEIATDDPGFAVDEPAMSLGQALKLPRFLESNRSAIEAVLPKVA
jgi:glyoxalase family protein